MATNRSLALIALLAPVCALVVHPARADDCFEVAGHVSFQGLQVEPPRPRVGDQVTLQFGVSLAVYSVLGFELQGAAPLLEGDTTISGGTQDATFHLTAVQAGHSSVQLAASYGTELQCTDADGHFYFTYGPSHTVVSQPYDITIVGDDSPCAGDCDSSGLVDVAELIRAVAIALGNATLDTCAAIDGDGDGQVTVDDLVAAVAAALSGCSTATPSPTPTNPPGSCCGCLAATFVECQALAQQTGCFGWGDPCPTATATPP